MKAIKLYNYSASILSFAILLFAVFSLSSCAKKISFIASDVVPAAQGRVKIKKDKNDNYAIEVSVTNLAEAKRLKPSKETYVVWIETENNGIKNIGRMNSSSGLFSSGLKASLNAISSYKPLRVFITAENDADILYPGSHFVLGTRTF